MSKPHFTVMTGAINNAGDYLIKKRTLALLDRLRPDRSIVSLDRWKPLTSEALATVNAGKALILAGGPALRKNLYPGIYPLVDDLNKIEVPIVFMGIGWKPEVGDYQDLEAFTFTKESRLLLDRSAGSGVLSSVRDYPSHLVTHSAGYNNFVFTGCPALYDQDFLDKPELRLPKNVRKVGFSIGVRFVKDPTMYQQTLDLVDAIARAFPGSEIVAALHHSLTERGDYRPTAEFVQAHEALKKDLRGRNVDTVQVDNSAEQMEEFYRGCDLHVGYRLHAHVLCMSRGQPSFLVAEDGRGLSFRQVLGETIFEGLSRPSRPARSVLSTIFRGTAKSDSTVSAKRLSRAMELALGTEFGHDFPLLRTAVRNVQHRFETMKSFVQQLP